MATFIHPTAVVEPGAKLGVDVHVGPFCTVAASATLGDGTVLDSYVRVHDNTTLGRGNRVCAFSALGGDPEDLKFDGEETFLAIGDDNDIREHVTINRGTAAGGNHTRIGDGNLFQNKTHVGHDCIIGNQVIVSATSAMAGHVELEDRCIIGGGSLIHQFCRVGGGTMVGFGSMVSKSVPPLSLLNGTTGLVEGANVVGLRRRDFSNAAVAAISQALQSLYAGQGTRQDRATSLLDSAAGQPDAQAAAAIRDLADFVLNRMGRRGLADSVW